VQALHALDGQPLVMQQSLDGLQQYDVLRPVETTAARAFQRRDEGEFGLPEAQDVLGRADFVGGFRDGPERVGAFGHDQAVTTAS
jgi:hypothetical protein